MTLEKNKQKQINDIVSVVKILSLLFLGVIICKSIFKDQMVIYDFTEIYYSMVSIVLPLMLLILGYFMWTFSNTSRVKKKYAYVINMIEAIGFIILFTYVIYHFGGFENEYKFLYLFIIITTTIQLGMKAGVSVSIVSSVIMLAMDILMVPSTDVADYFQNDMILAAVFILTAWPLGFYVKIEDEHIRSLEEKANIDGLTALYNHRYFHEELRKIIERANKENKKVSMIFIDIDYFKHYNDLYGHQKGDVILHNMAQIIKQNCRKKDVVARYGGEEFAVILYDTSESVAMIVAERIRRAIETTYFEGEENQPNGKMTASFGISIFPDKAKDDMELIKSADDALYRAKFFNKNRVEAYTSILDEIKSNIDEKDEELVASVKTLISVINAKDRYTYGHVERVVIYGRLLADKLNFSEKDKKTFIYGAYMHDIGKINIPEEILVKKMRLTNEEWEQLKQHPSNGVEIIKSVEALKDIRPLILHHHERYDGTGYPDRLKGEEIPYFARALTIIDSFDAMTSNRPYNKRKTYKEACEELIKCSGTQFDPEIAKAFVEVINSREGIAKIEQIKNT